MGNVTYAALAEAANFVVDRAVPLGRLITHRYSLDQAPEAYALFDTGATGKPVIIWEQDVAGAWSPSGSAGRIRRMHVGP